MVHSIIVVGDTKDRSEGRPRRWDQVYIDASGVEGTDHAQQHRASADPFLQERGLYATPLKSTILRSYGEGPGILVTFASFQGDFDAVRCNLLSALNSFGWRKKNIGSSVASSKHGVEFPT